MLNIKERGAFGFEALVKYFKFILPHRLWLRKQRLMFWLRGCYECWSNFYRLPAILNNYQEALENSESLREAAEKELEEVQHFLPKEKEKDFDELYEEERDSLIGGPDYDERPEVLYRAIKYLRARGIYGKR